ncbi:hypothetical protein CEUSTIGMA_g7306.t1 [Chlamydomonas eustigma]|uniref:EF-hand domain-containing protein n=1 Tax=Chlamydomonas eustigma TaxID=1157962 RepID=A0A250X9Z5_9CHLO|nr:hypothetical protein CEUSTIGMA_g7306.t1 [Chlamydomonas eustigma]|eukprot:GAX79866.1 hypothetical protein CEUSTIGMA_g7306.t1 [Chlamydomonas eustigma]
MDAFDQYPPSCSYYSNRVDDLGRSTVQHKPLYKGEHTQDTLAKVFNDPSMRPKISGPVGREPYNKTLTSLITTDIWGASSKPKDILTNPRGTNPLDPRYVLSSSKTSFSRPSSAVAKGQRDSIRDILQHSIAPQAEDHGGRDIMSVADIDGARPKTFERAGHLSNATLDAKDIEGSWPGWKHPFRAHVGVNLRDPGLNVSDINNYLPRRNYRNLYKDQPQQGSGGGGQPTASISPPVLPAQTHHSEVPQPAPLPPGFIFTGLPVFQAPAPEVWAPASTMPSQGEMDAHMVARQQHEEVRRVAAEVDAAKLARHDKNDVNIAHRALISQAQGKEELRRSADDMISELSISRQQVEGLWAAFKAADREGSGCLTVAEMGIAFQRAGVRQSRQQMEALAAGLRDNVGLLPYRDLAKVLMAKSKNPGSDLKLFGIGLQRKPPVPAARSASASRPKSAVPAASLRGSHPSRPGSAVFKPNKDTSAADIHIAQHSAQTSPTPLSSIPAAAVTNYIVDQISATEQTGGPQLQEPAMIPQDSAPQQPTEERSVALNWQQRQQFQDWQNQNMYVSETGQEYHPYKSQTYWFGGAEGIEAQRIEAAAWKASHDATHKVTTYHIGESVAAAKTAAANHQVTTVTPSVIYDADPSGRPQSARPYSDVSDGAGQQPQRPTSATRAQHGAASQEPSGASLGSTLKGAVPPVGTAALINDIVGQVHTRSGISRPSSAVQARRSTQDPWVTLHGGSGTQAAAGKPSVRPISARPHASAGMSFSSVAQSQGGPKMENLNRHMMRADIEAVRGLY